MTLRFCWILKKEGLLAESQIGLMMTLISLITRRRKMPTYLQMIDIEIILKITAKMMRNSKKI